MTHLTKLASLSLLTLGLLCASPSPAAAAEVMCQNDFGSCTVSNDGQSWISCSCIDESGTGGTGGDEYAGMSEDQLMAVCLEELAWCDGAMTGDGDGDGDGMDTGTSTGTSGDGDGDTSTSGDGDGDTGTDGGDGDGDSSTGTSSTGGDTGADSDGDGTGDGDGDGDGTGDGDSDSGTGSGEDGNGSGGGETGGGEDETSAGSEVDEGGNCAVNEHASGFGLLVLSFLGLLGLRRREDDLDHQGA